RMDEQVKVRGYRIELGEIESVIRKQTGVRDVAVIAREDQSGDKYICAYVVSEDQANEVEVDVAQIKSEIKKDLPEYMIPSYFLTLEKLPVTANGKLDRRALPEPTILGIKEYTAPRNELDETLVAIFKEVLGLDQVSIDDSFFELGGHSLRATRVVNLIESNVGIRLPLKTLFERSTIIELSEILKNTEETTYEAIPQVEKQAYYPMSSAQKRMYIINKMDDLGTVYNMPGVMKIERGLELEKIKNVFQKLTQRHEGLRTSFHMVEGELVQKIEDEVEIDFSYEEIDDAEGMVGIPPINELLGEFLRPFNLGEAPLLRTKVVKYGEEKNLLMFDMHHIISDGATINIITKEFSQMYDGDELKALDVQYKDYSEWMRKKDISNQEAYWMDQLSDDIPVLDLPLDYPRPQSQQFSGAAFDTNISAITKAEVQQLCKQTGTTEYMALLSTLMVLLHKYSRQEDIIIGSPISGRTHEDTENVIGMFVNTLAMRGRPEGQKSYVDFLAEIKETCLKGYENQEYPFEDVVDKVNVKRDMSRNPIFDVMFVLQNNEEDELSAQGLAFEEIQTVSRVAKFDLTITVNSTSEGYMIDWEYCDELFKEETVRRMAAHFEQIVSEVLGNPTKKISEIEVITEMEKNQILFDFNDTKVVYPKDKSIKELFEDQVRKTPQEIAIVYDDQKMTYDELDTKANIIANELISWGVKPNDVVAFSLKRSSDLMAAILGILKSGGAFLPVDINYPAERKEFIVLDSQAKVLISEDPHVVQEIAGCRQVQMVDLLNGVNSSNPMVEIADQSLCYCIYTSGSTGNPKGVNITLANLLNYLMYCKQEYVTGQPIMPLFTNICFDLTMTSIFVPLCFGGKLFIYNKGIEIDLFDVFNNQELSIIKLTPSHLKLICGHDKAEIMSNLKCLIVGGEELESKTAYDTLQKLGMHIDIHNEYGPTETTIGCCDYIYHANSEANTRTVLIGKPISNTQTYIMNENQLCGVGMIGELCIGGEGVGRGYLNRPELTTEKFVNHPYQEGTTMYRTGDLAKWLPDGNLQYLGRVDEQVKVRGFRIELGEIEEVIRRYEGIRDVTVIVREDQSGDKYICAYVVSEDQADEVDIAQMKSKIRKDLPEYMIPSYFLMLEKLPVTANGKLDRRALPEPDMLGTKEYVTPRTELEETLVAIFKEVLALEQVSIDDSFFELGGHSLRAIRVVNLIESNVGIRMPLKTLFERQTVMELSEVLQNTKETTYKAIPQVEKQAYYPMSSAQKRMYIINTMDDLGTVYNMPGVMEIEGGLELEKIKDVFQKLTQRHEGLRTSFHMVEGELVQKIEDEVEIDFAYEEIVGTPTPNINELLGEFLRPFNYREAPLLRTKVVKYGEEKNLLMFDMHHIISDGATMNIITKEFSQMYNGEKLKALNVQYKDYSEWMRKKDISNQEAYWIDQFSDEIPVLDLPLDYPRPQSQQFSGADFNIKLSAMTKAQVQQLCKQTGTTEYMALLSTLMVLLHKYSQQEDIIVVGSPISGRTHEDTENVIGMFVNTLAMRGKPEGQKSYADFLAEIKETCLKGYENQEYPFEDVVDKVNVKRDMSRNPIFDVLFVLQNNEVEEVSAEGLQFKTVEIESNIAQFDLTVTVENTLDGYMVNWEYCDKLFHEETIRRMAVHFEHILHEILDAPTKQIREIEIITEMEKNQILCEFNDTKVEYEHEKTILDLFEEWVVQSPTKTAILYEEQEVMYEELNSRANQIAGFLLNNRLKDEDVVGIMLDRTPDMIRSIMGIWKAGGAYLPLDVDHPIQRRLDILQEANVKYILTLSKHVTEEFKNGYHGEIICLDQIEKQLDAINQDDVKKRINPSSLAYILFTSGSTGKPKGVMIEHAGMLNHILAERDMLELDQRLVFAQNANHCFDISVWQMVGALALGGTTVIYSNELVLEPKRFVDSIAKDRVTLLEVVPSYMSVMMDYIEDSRIRLPELKYLMITGEMVKPYLLRQWFNICAEIPVINAYGPAEASDDICQHVIRSMPETMVNVPIGKPLNNVSIYILDSVSRLCPVGVVGELCVAGV
ncbi:amino acid adenylation domain-containing protein, partial [Fontibacillus panacisegetis]